MDNKTAEQFLEEAPISHYYDPNQEKMVCFADDVQKIMIDFAKYHVKLALEKASDDVRVVDESCWAADSYVDRDSILNSYPLENIG